MIRIMLGRLRVGAICLGLAMAASVPQSVWALGLGEIELNSALNERLKAEIELLDASGLEPTEIFVSLASAEDFERVGVERFFFLTDLRFEVGTGANGRAVIKVTSAKAITEPYLNFMLEILWPSGRLLKEYTVLLDPPTFSQAAAPVVSVPSQERASSQSEGRIERSVASTSGTRVQLDPDASAGQDSRMDRPGNDSQSRMTGRDDTLWTIAMRTRPSAAVSVQQNMLAIQRLNPEAFINANINLLKAGFVLRLPTEREALALNSSEANQQVAQQNESWRSSARGESAPAPVQEVADGGAEPLRGQLDATSAAPSPAPSGQTTEGELRIVAGNGDSATGKGAADGAALNAALEEKDRLGREVDELTYQLDREKELAASQLEVKERQLEVKDQQIVEMQDQMREMQEQIRAIEQNQNQRTTTTEAATWWQSPYVLYGGVGALVLLLVGGLMRARRGRTEPEEFYKTEPVAQPARREPRRQPVQTFADHDLNETQARHAATLIDEEFDVQPEARDDDVTQRRPRVERNAAPDAPAARSASAMAAAATAATAATAIDEAAPRGSETGDVIGEADIYIAYGRFPQAIGLLLGVLEDEPERNDVRLKLLEVYADTNDQEGFDTHMNALLEHCDDDDALLVARDLAARLSDDDLASASSAAAVEGSSSYDSGDVMDAGDESRYADDDTADADDGFELSLDDERSSIDFEPAAESAAAKREPEIETSGQTADSRLDFELELEELAGSSLDDGEDGGASDELGGDLGLDFDPETDVADELSLDDVLERDALMSAESADDADASALEELEFESEVATAEDDDFGFNDEGDSAGTKLDLARAYIDMGDQDGARDILQEVLDEGSADQQQQAQALLETL